MFFNFLLMFDLCNRVFYISFFFVLWIGLAHALAVPSDCVRDSKSWSHWCHQRMHQQNFCIPSAPITYTNRCQRSPSTGSPSRSHLPCRALCRIYGVCYGLSMTPPSPFLVFRWHFRRSGWRQQVVSEGWSGRRCCRRRICWEWSRKRRRDFFPIVDFYYHHYIIVCAAFVIEHFIQKKFLKCLRDSWRLERTVRFKTCKSLCALANRRIDFVSSLVENF